MPKGVHTMTEGMRITPEGVLLRGWRVSEETCSASAVTGYAPTDQAMYHIRRLSYLVVKPGRVTEGNKYFLV